MIAMLFKDIIKQTSLYQEWHKMDYLPISKERFNNLSDAESTPIRVCYYKGNKVNQLENMLNNIIIRIEPNKKFQSWIDTGLIVVRFHSMVDNFPPNYEKIINKSVNEMIQDCKHDNGVGRDIRQFLIAVKEYINRISSTIESNTLYETDPYLKATKNYFDNMIFSRANSLEEALQRIIFWSSLFWQSNHRLMGIGRLDKLLGRFVDDMNTEELEDHLYAFMLEMHRYYPYKSGDISKGDTGQIIILGGKEEAGGYFCNQLTYSFINCIRRNPIPDPKILLRTSMDMPDDLLRLALDTIKTGVGCPLLSNDEVVVPALISFGYKLKDAYNYATSACWEPLSYGNSLEKNNIITINFANPIVAMTQDERFLICDEFEEVLELYKEKLDSIMDKVIAKLDGLSWEYDPLVSLFTDACCLEGKDVSEGGAEYCDYGVLSAGLGNAVNSLINLRNKCFVQDRKYSLPQIQKVVVNNYEDDEEIASILQKGDYYGHDDEETIRIVRDICDHVSKRLLPYRNRFGGKVKWGLSSPSYLELGKETGATIDGRKRGQPLMTHISSKGNNAYTDLINFSSKIDYSGIKSNGNVIDMIMSPELFKKSFERVYALVKGAIKVGYFQMQINVVESTTLIRAKSHPEEFPNLIVRVWGFSAYFNDLPEDYKDMLINRTLQSEGRAL